MHPYSSLITSFLLASAILAYDHELVGNVKLVSPNKCTFRTVGTSVDVPLNLSGVPSASASVLVSLDSEHCPTSARVGINFEVGSDPTQLTYFAWYQIPGLVSSPFTGFQISPGDNVVLNVTAPYHNSSSVLVYIENVSKSTSYSRVIEGKYEPCGREVEWRVSNIPLDGDPTHYHDTCNFGNLKLTNAVAYGPAGQSYGPQDPLVQYYYMSDYNGTTVATTMIGQNAINFTYVYDEVP